MIWCICRSRCHLGITPKVLLFSRSAEGESVVKYRRRATSPFSSFIPERQGPILKCAATATVLPVRPPWSFVGQVLLANETLDWISWNVCPRSNFLPTTLSATLTRSVNTVLYTRSYKIFSREMQPIILCYFIKHNAFYSPMLFFGHFSWICNCIIFLGHRDVGEVF